MGSSTTLVALFINVSTDLFSCPHSTLQNLVIIAESEAPAQDAGFRFSVGNGENDSWEMSYFQLLKNVETIQGSIVSESEFGI